MARLFQVVMLVVVTASAAGCLDPEEDGQGPREEQQAWSKGKNSLYERIGGEPVLNKVVSDIVERASVDPQINWSRPGAPQGWRPTRENFEEFKQGLTRFVSAQTGGPAKYDGPDMKEVHQGMRITGREFDAFMTHVRAALANFNVPEGEQQELIGVFQRTRGDIVEPPQQKPQQQQQRQQEGE